MEVEFFKAQCGDACKVSFKSGAHFQHIFIDSGYERTYRDILRQEIELIASKNEKIALWILSHIHDDHIGGAIAYISAVKSGRTNDIVQRWLYNPPRESAMYAQDRTEVISEAKSISQGDKLSAYLGSINKLTQSQIVAPCAPIRLSPLTVTILSPSQEKLKQLIEKYHRPEISLERSELDTISEAKAKRNLDFRTKVEDFNLSKWHEDKNIENGSSIAHLIEHGSVKVLFLADAHPSTVLETLLSLGYSRTSPLQCNLVKVSHHGSSGNNSSGLYEIIRCRNYVISVNGDNIHGLPTKESIVRILTSSTRNIEEKYTFYFTYDDSTLRSIFSVDGEEIFDRLNFEVKYLSTDNKGIKFSFEI